MNCCKAADTTQGRCYSTRITPRFKHIAQTNGVFYYTQYLQKQYIVYSARILDEVVEMTVYSCGRYTRFAVWLFSHASLFDCTTKSFPYDVLVSARWNPCPCTKKFRGVTIFVNGEDTKPSFPNERTIGVGVAGIEVRKDVSFAYGAFEYILRDLHTTRNLHPKIWGVAYIASNCASFKHNIAIRLSKYVDVYAFGKCVPPNAIRMPRLTGDWDNTYKIYKDFAFVLAADHGYTKGYVTEKLFLAAASQAIPIYHGDVNTAQFYLNKERVLWWGKNTPLTVRSLLSNKTAYAEMRKLEVFNTDNFKKARNYIKQAVRRQVRCQRPGRASGRC